MIRSKSISIAILTLLLSSCSSTVSKEWSCRNTDSKLGCVSISKADQVYSSELTGQALPKTIQSDNADSAKYSSFSASTNATDTEDKRLTRTSDKIGRIWIAPYMDAKGNYHEASYIQTIDEFAKWEVKKVNTINITKNKQKQK